MASLPSHPDQDIAYIYKSEERESKGVRVGYITWHVPHAAQNGPGFDLEGLLALFQALVHEIHHFIWCQITSGRIEKNSDKDRDQNTA